MHCIINLLAILACTGSALAYDMPTRKFRNLNLHLSGQMIHWETCHVVTAAHGRLHEGESPRVLNRSTDPRIKGVNIGRNLIDTQLQNLILSWPTPPPRVANTRDIRLVPPTICPTHLAVETITHRDDRRGGKQRMARIGNIATTQLWFQHTSLPCLLPERRSQTHQLNLLRDGIRLLTETHNIWNRV